MREYYLINGYWKDDSENPFVGYLVSVNDDSVDEQRDDEIFFYFTSLNELQESAELGENTVHDFVVTNYMKEPCCVSEKSETFDQTKNIVSISIDDEEELAEPNPL